jgi:hypothetical protein
MGSAMGMLGRIVTHWNAAPMDTGFSVIQAVVLSIFIVILFTFEVIHEKKMSVTELTDRFPFPVRGALYLLAVMSIVIFGVWGPGYSAQAFIYFQF